VQAWIAIALRASRWRGEARPERRGLPHRTQGEGSAYPVV